MVNWWWPVVLGAFLSFLLIGVVMYGIANRPIISYYLEAPEIINFRWDSYLTVKLKFKNKGNTDASVLLRVTVKNAIILNDTIKSPHKLVSESEAEFYYAATGNMKDYAIVKVHIVPENNPESFTITFIVEKRFHPSWSGVFSFIFGELRGYYPTSLTFIRTNMNTYQKE